MQTYDSRLAAWRLVLWGAIVTLLGALLSGPVSLAVLTAIRPSTPWVDPATFARSYSAVEALPYFLGFMLVAGSVMMITAIYHASEDRHKATVSMAVVSVTIYAALIFFNYVNQTTFVPALVRNYRPEYDVLIAALTMANPLALAWALEMWGYAFLGLATALAAPVFYRSRLEKVLAWLLIANGVVSVATALITAADLEWVLSTPGLVGFMVWNVLLIVITFLVVVAARRRIAVGAADRGRAERASASSRQVRGK
jgi:hypothetical protein